MAASCHNISQDGNTKKQRHLRVTRMLVGKEKSFLSAGTEVLDLRNNNRLLVVSQSLKMDL